MLVDAIKALAGISTIDLSELKPVGYIAGLDWLKGMADGVRENMATLVAALALVGVEIKAITAELLARAAFAVGEGWIGGLAAGIRNGVPDLQAALQAVGDLFPHSPAKAGPLRRAPDWAAYLNFGLIDAATQVAGVLSGVGGGMTVAPAAISRQSSVTPVRSRSSGNYAPATINFTYAPAVSLASEREAQEIIAPMLRTVMEREGRR